MVRPRMMDAEKWSAAVNAAGLGFHGIGIAWLFFQAPVQENIVNLILAVVFAITNILFWIMQMTYHLVRKPEKEKEMLRRVDHVTVFYLVIGSFSPAISRYGAGVMIPVALVTLWCLAIVGTMLRLFWARIPRVFTPIFSFLMAVVCIVSMIIAVTAIPVPGIIIFIVGSVLLITGGVVYAIKKPDPVPGTFGSHEVYHVLVLAGAILMYFLVVIALVS